MDKQIVVCAYNGIFFGNKKGLVLIHAKTWVNLMLEAKHILYG